VSESFEHQERQRIEQEISNYLRRVKKYHTNFNNSGIWLFLAVLGCWSIQPLDIKGLAVITTTIIFSHKLVIELESYKPFSRQKKDIEKIINESNLNDDAKGFLKYQLLVSAQKWESKTRYIKYLPAYYLSIIFFIVSLFKWYE